MFSIVGVAIFMSDFTLSCGKNVVINCCLVRSFYSYGNLLCQHLQIIGSLI